MSENASDSVMRRKAGAGRPPPEIGRINATGVLRMAVAQAAENELGLVAAATSLVESRKTLANVADILPEDALFTLCHAGGENFAMVVLDAQSLAALIEMQTTGRVVPKPAQPRAPTRTDALLCAKFIDTVLELFEQSAAEVDLDIAPSIAGYRYVMPLADLRAIEMTMPDCHYRHYDVQVDFSQGAKAGQMQIFLPFEQAVGISGAQAKAWQQDLNDLVEGTHVEMEAVLARKKLSLSEVTALQIGSLVTLPREVVSRVEVQDLDGSGVTLGRLGQSGGMRAICISDPDQAVDPETAAMAQAPDMDAMIGAAPNAAPAGLDSDMAATLDIAADSDMNLTGDAGLGDLPDAGLGGLPDAGLGDLPDIAGLGGSDDLPDLASMGDLGDLGDLGGTDGLPDLADLPDLENL